eukprot:9704303-Alexandrium_andersonii.AAC.1
MGRRPSKHASTAAWPTVGQRRASTRHWMRWHLTPRFRLGSTHAVPRFRPGGTRAVGAWQKSAV